MMSAPTVPQSQKNSESRAHSPKLPDRHEPTVDIFRDIHEISDEEWNSIVPEGAIQQSHAFIRTCQKSGVEGASYWHLMIRQGGRLIATASISRMIVSLDLLASQGLRRATGTIRRRYPSFMRIPVLFCGLPVSFGQPCITMRDKADIPQVTAIVSEAMEGIAAQSATGLLCWKEFDSDVADALVGLVKAGYFRVRSLPSCSMSIPWNDFGSYLLSLRSPYRRQVRASLEVRKRARLRIRVLVDFESEIPAIFSLYEQVIDRAEHRLERLNESFFAGLNKNLGLNSRAIVIDIDSEPVAAAVVLNSGSSAFYLLAGINYEKNWVCQGYPNLVTEVLRDVIHSGAKRLEMGQTSYYLKSRLGAVESPRWLFLRYRTRSIHMLLKAASGVLFPATKYPIRRVFK